MFSFHQVRDLSSTASGRYHIETRPAPDIVPHPSRFRVQVNKRRLVTMVLHELRELAGTGRVRVALSRPCVYGVFDRIVGGLAPRHEACVGCLRCTMQYPDVVQIHPNAERLRLGDAYLLPDYVDTILYEARTGRVPVRGAGYRGLFGGRGWDGMWTDMSEIVRPTRDGIHGREHISTVVDIGEKPSWLRFDPDGAPVGPRPRLISLPVPFLFDLPPAAATTTAVCRIMAGAAARIGGLALLPVDAALAADLTGPEVVPLVRLDDRTVIDRLVPLRPRMVELDGWDVERFDETARRLPATLVAVRVPMGSDPVPLVEEGARIIHLAADYHGQTRGGFARDLITHAHERLISWGRREEVTLIGSGGIVQAEHVPKAIICGVDAVALDTALWVALQARFGGGCLERSTAAVSFPKLDVAWGVQRLQNLAGSWRDQLIEILGAMGLREVRRLRGEKGRAMFQADLEREAFGGIAGYAAIG